MYLLYGNNLLKGAAIFVMAQGGKMLSAGPVYTQLYTWNVASVYAVSATFHTNINEFMRKKHPGHA